MSKAKDLQGEAHPSGSLAPTPDGLEPMSRSALPVSLIVVGLALVLLGVLAWAGALSWFGRLPGDIRIERPNMRVYIPITSMVIVSVVLSVVLAIARRMR